MHNLFLGCLNREQYFKVRWIIPSFDLRSHPSLQRETCSRLFLSPLAATHAWRSLALAEVQPVQSFSVLLGEGDWWIITDSLKQTATFKFSSHSPTVADIQAFRKKRKEETKQWHSWPSFFSWIHRGIFCLFDFFFFKICIIWLCVGSRCADRWGRDTPAASCGNRRQRASWRGSERDLVCRVCTALQKWKFSFLHFLRIALAVWTGVRAASPTAPGI